MMKKRLFLPAFAFMAFVFGLVPLTKSHPFSGNTYPEKFTIPDTLTTDTLFFDLEETVVVAFHRSQRLIEVPASLTSIDNVVLEREKPAYNLFPVLEYSPGIFIHWGATNTSRVTIRGIGARVPYATGKIRGYFNNIPLTNTSGVTFIQDIDPAVVESMEIIKGPATSVYGAGLGGTINITARRPAAQQTGVTNTFQAGSFDKYRNSVVADLVRDRFATSLVYSHTQSQGYRQNNEFRRNTITSVSQFNRAEQTHFTALLSYTDLKSHIPSSIDSLTFVNNPRAAAANWLKTEGYEDSERFLGGITVSHAFHEKFTADMSLFTIWHDEKEMRPFDVFYEERLTFGTRSKATRKWNPGSASLELIAGGELFLEDYRYSNHENIDGEGIQGEQLSDNREDVVAFNLFLQSDASLNRWNFSAGVNLNYTSLQYHDLFHEGAQDLSGRYDYGLILSPRISAGYVYHERNSAYLTLSHGFSPPSLAETLTPEGTINPDIRPEKSWNLEIGFRGHLMENRLFYDLSLYRMQVQDLLVAERVGEDAWVGKNAGESLHRGIEAELYWVILRDIFSENAAWKEISLRSNYTFNHFRFTDFVDLDEDFSGNRIPGVPDHVFFTALYGQLSNGIYAMAGWRFAGSMAMNDANSRHTDAYHLTDLTLGFEREISPGWETDIFFRINNLFDETYASMILVNAPSFGGPPRYYYPGLPRSFTMGLKVGFW